MGRTNASASLRLPRAFKEYHDSLQNLGSALTSTLSLLSEVQQTQETIRASKASLSPGDLAHHASDEHEVSSVLGMFCAALSDVQSKVRASGIRPQVTEPAATAPTGSFPVTHTSHSETAGDVLASQTAAGSFAGLHGMADSMASETSSLTFSSLLEQYSDLVVRKLSATP